MTAAPRPAFSASPNLVAPSGADGGQSTDGRVVFFSPWGGSANDQLGRERLVEGNPSGPMSLATDATGRTYVLDQVNGRVVRHGADGAVEAAIPVPVEGAQDLAVAADGSLVVLDRLVGKQVNVYDPSGRLRAEIPLDGVDVGDPGFLTGVFVDGKDVYVEREHGSLSRIGDTSGPAATPDEVPGRPSRDGATWLHAGIVDPSAGRTFVSAVDRATGQHRFTRELRQKAEVRSILLLDSDAAGTIYFATELADGDHEWVALTCLEPRHGQPVGAAVLPVNTLPEETFRDLTVLDRGGVVYALRSDTGVSYQAYECH